MKENIVADARLRKMAEDGGGKKWLIRGAATLAMLGGIAAAPQTDTVTERVDDLVQSVLQMAIAPAEAATVSGVTIDNAKEVPSRTTTSSGDKTADYLIKGSAYYQSNNSSGKTTWYGLSNGQNQTGLVVYNTALDTSKDFTASGAFYMANYGSGAADYNGILLSSILPDSLGSGTGGGGLGITGIKNAISFGIDMYNNGSTYKDASGTYPMVGIRTTDSSGNLTQATSDSSLTSGSGVSSVPASNAPSGIGSGDGAAWTIKYTASNKTLTFSLGGKVTKTMTINTTTMPYLSFALIGSAGDKLTEMTSSVAQVSGTKASMTVPVTYKDTAGNVLKTGTTLAVGDGQSVGINNASPKASSDTYSYDAPKITGYNISSANDITVKVGSGTTPSLNLVYAPALQEATVTTSGLVGNSASGNGTTTYKGTTGGTISISDSSLTKAGYTYKVTAPDGQTYDTMAAALAAGTNGKYDATDNASTATTDSQQQAFKVVYTAQPQTAEFAYTGATPQSGSPTTLTGTSDGAIANTALYAPAGYKIDTAATTLASGVSLSMATDQRSATIYGKFDTDTATNQKSTIVFAPLTQTAQIDQVVNGAKSTVETKTGGSNSAIAFSATDSSLAKAGYTYKVTGPNGQVYDTLDAALKANPNYDTTNATDTDGSPQIFTVSYTDTQAPAITTGKDTFNVTTGAGVTAADFLAGVNAQTSDNQMAGDVKVTSNYDSVVKDEPGTYTVTITATDASGLQTTKQVTVVVTETSPYDQESAVASAAAALESTSRDATKTTADVQAAQDALNQALADAKTARETANSNAAAAITNATTQDVATDDAVAQAITAVQTAQANAASNMGTTQAIVDATTALEKAVAVASAQAIVTNPVSQEPDVKTAQSDLDTVLSNPDATAAEIATARDALKQAVADAVTDRDAAKDTAATANNAAATSAAAQDQAVIDAQDKLAQAIADADGNSGTTQAILDAVSELNTAVTTAEKAQETARAAAAAALAAMTPVSNEANVLAAAKSLKEILDNENATAAEIEAKTTALTDVVDPAKEARDTQVTAANNAVTAAEAGDNANDQGVKDAIATLQQVVSDATNEATNTDLGHIALTQDIADAMTKLADAISQAQSDRATAVEQATDAMAADNTTPVSLEDDTASAKATLQAVLDDPTATAADITVAINDFKNAIDDVRDDRQVVDEAAADALTAATNSGYADEQAVQQAMQDLQDVRDQAAADGATSADITAAQTALENALAAAKSTQDQAIADAQAIATNPVTNEPEVVAATQKLADLVAEAADGGDVSTADIVAAGQAITAAVAAAESERDDANDAAQTAITDAQATNQAEEPGVTAAISHLQDLLTQAANDDPNALTADIIAATAAVKQAVQDAAQAQQDARDAANAVDTAPVSSEQSVVDAKSELAKVVGDPTATVAEINAAQQDLEDAVNDEKAKRDTTNEAADDALTTASNSDQADEPAVIAAQNALQQAQANAANDAGTTAEIADATKALTDAIAQAKADQQTARDEAAAVDTAPVSNESGVKAAQTALDKVLADTGATVKEIEDATNALENAVDAANSDREAANAKADSAKLTATGTAQANEPGVQDAIANLTALQNQAATDDANALTQDILDAITALQDAVTDAAGDQQEARLAADNALAQTKPVSHESATQDAMTKLQTLLADDSATTADIQAATKALSQAVSDDTKVRTAANTAAASEIASAQNSTAANDAAVRDAVQALQDAVKTAASDSPDAVTQDILDHISDLKAAVTAAEQAQETKRSEAATILADDSETQPVTYEQATAEAKVALQQVIDNPLATAADLQTAIDQYRDTATATRAVRDDAMTAGADAVTSAQNSDQSGDERVVTAIQNLQKVMATAASDSPDALTADIEAAISAVKQAQVDAAKSRAEAADLATAALQQTGPVTNEADVATARTKLQTLIDDPTSTEQDLKNAMNELATAVTAAKTDRTTTNNEANKAITTATNGDQSAAPAVQTAIQNLKDVMATAASDSPDALTADIATATAALQQAVADEDAAQEMARAAAATALSETAPVSNETAVASEINALKNVLQDPKATAADITAAVTALQSAVQTDTGTRNTANDDAATAIADAENSSLQNEPQIENAIANLNAIRERAAADSSASLTADIIAATDALRQAMTDVAQYQADARADAAEAQQATTTDGTTVHSEIADSKAVSEDTQTALTDAVTALNDALKNPDTPYADIKTATDKVFEAGGKALTEAATPYSDNATVESALATMQTTLADPDATAAEKHAAMDSLRATFADAAAALTDAKTAAQDALSKTAPVSNETAVKDTADKLQSLLADPTATKTAIEDATKALNQAVADANAARDAANQAADKLADQAQQSAGSGDPAVVAALAKLQKVQAAAATDSPEALTQDIAAATQALQQALDAVNSARDAANDAIAQAKPVSYESAVAAAIKHLQQALADPATSTADLDKAVNAVKTATQAAKVDRDAANQAANAMRQAATKTGQNDPTVQAAVTKLAKLQQLAATDNQDALTADIKAATDALKVAMQAVDDVRTAADTLLGQTKPVSHEGAVADASKQLRVLLAGNAAEGDIKSAMQTLQTALDKAKPARQQAQSQATDLLTQVQNSPVRNEPAVQEIMQRLQAVMAAADQDDPKALTQDILNAMQDLQTAFNNAQAARDTANQDATALKNSVPADMSDTIKDAWNHLADVQAKASRGEATTADVVAATKALADAIGQNNGIVSGPQARQAQQNAELATLGATYQPTMTTLPAAVQAGYTAIPSGYLPYTGAGVLPYTATGRMLAAGTANRVLPDTGLDTMSYLTAIGVFLFASNLFMLFAARRKREVEEN
ncbi:lectin-like domain-containing protein [Weissella cibaria]|uniref:lectin-like domain-containing protein n=1 Tax=Weissella cibaria TaxID=137591 RepID=UPI003D36095F